MTETEWNECSDIQKMLKFVKGDRKKRLFACASIRQDWNLLEDDRSKQAVIVAEQYADGLVSEEKLRQSCVHAWSAAYAANASVNAWIADLAAFVADSCSWDISTFVAYMASNCNIFLLKDIFDPFNKYKKPQCDGYTKEFVRTIYDNPNEKGELLDLHVLADMLIDQNVDQVLVDHLRSGVHVRGCQVLDLVMHN